MHLFAPNCVGVTHLAFEPVEACQGVSVATKKHKELQKQHRDTFVQQVV